MTYISREGVTSRAFGDLKLFGMATNWPEIVACGRHAALDPEELMRQFGHVEERGAAARAALKPATSFWELTMYKHLAW